MAIAILKERQTKTTTRTMLETPPSRREAYRAMAKRNYCYVGAFAMFHVKQWVYLQTEEWVKTNIFFSHSRKTIYTGLFLC